MRVGSHGAHRRLLVVQPCLAEAMVKVESYSPAVLRDINVSPRRIRNNRASATDAPQDSKDGLSHRERFASPARSITNLLGIAPPGG